MVPKEPKMNTKKDATLEETLRNRTHGKEQQLQRETSEKNMIQTMQVSLEAMHTRQLNRAAMEAVPHAVCPHEK